MHFRRTGHSPPDPKATPDEARKFINDAEQKLLLLGIDAGRADWIKSTYITDDTEAIAAKLDEKAIAAAVDYAKQSTRFDGLKLDPVTARKIKLLKTLPHHRHPVRSRRRARSSPASSPAWKARTARANIVPAARKAARISRS